MAFRAKFKGIKIGLDENTESSDKAEAFWNDKKRMIGKNKGNENPDSLFKCVFVFFCSLCHLSVISSSSVAGIFLSRCFVFLCHVFSVDQHLVLGAGGRTSSRSMPQDS